ncbi:MAG: hypothetical protein P0111_01590 [Nitrospira sp.]|nr:hypothetical protein [Nitrospira sp.]
MQVDVRHRLAFWNQREFQKAASLDAAAAASRLVTAAHGRLR